MADFRSFMENRALRVDMVPLARLERALPKKLDFESSASTNSTTGALWGGL